MHEQLSPCAPPPGLLSSPQKKVSVWTAYKHRLPVGQSLSRGSQPAAQIGRMPPLKIVQLRSSAEQRGSSDEPTQNSTQFPPPLASRHTEPASQLSIPDFGSPSQSSPTATGAGSIGTQIFVFQELPLKIAAVHFSPSSQSAPSFQMSHF